MGRDTNGTTRARLLATLKRGGARSVVQLAEGLGVTPVAVRQHLSVLEAEGCCDYEERRQRVGRPLRLYRATAAANARFPDRHADLTVGLLQSMRATFGPEGLRKLIDERTRRQLAAYRAALPSPDAPLEERVAALAARRDAEGYMADWRPADDGAYELIESHCPICVAATACQGLCAGELALFRGALGPDAEVERTEHLLDGTARRCVYRIRPRTTGPA